MAKEIRAPVLSYDDLRDHAARFLNKYHPSLSIPVPVEDIIDLHFKIDIVPVPGLLREFEVDAFINSDLKTISVDEFIYEARPARYRFSLAHELSHAILHQKVFEALRFSTISEWKAVVQGIPEETYGWLEYQGYALAGLILVPREPLAKHFKATVATASRHGLTLKKASEAARHIIEGNLAKQFEVSAGCIQKRIEKDDLWESA